MTLALATRGYICLGRRGAVSGSKFGTGPNISAIEEVKPDVRAASSGKEVVPEITSAEGPGLSATAEIQPDTDQGAPSISGVDELSPDIGGAKEE